MLRKGFGIMFACVLVLCATVVRAGQAVPMKKVVLAPFELKLVTMMCPQSLQHATRSGAYFTTPAGIPNHPFKNPVKQQIPILDVTHDNIAGMQFGLGNPFPVPTDVTIWLGCDPAPF